MRDLTTAEQEYLYGTSPDKSGWVPGNCPFCGAENPWLEGPRGGLSINLMCEQCHTKINWCGPLPAQLIELGPDISSIYAEDGSFKNLQLKKKPWWAFWRSGTAR